MPGIGGDGVQADVELHEGGGAQRVHGLSGGRRAARAGEQGEVRLPAGRRHERVPQPAQALQHAQGRPQPGRQGLRRGHPAWVGSQVLIWWCWLWFDVVVVVV